jgi:hypothetical protein
MPLPNLQGVTLPSLRFMKDSQMSLPNLQGVIASS